MATWRRKAIESFPELREDLNDRKFTIYMLFFELLPLSRKAHRGGNRKLLQTIYGFSQWCAEQRTGDVNTKAALAFYEHLFDEPELWERVASYLSTEKIRAYWPLIAAHQDPERLMALRKFLGKKAP